MNKNDCSIFVYDNAVNIQDFEPNPKFSWQHLFL